MSESSNISRACAKRPPLPNRCSSAERGSNLSNLSSTNQIQNTHKAHVKPHPDTQKYSANSSHLQRCSSLDRSPSTPKSLHSENTSNIGENGKRVIHISYPASNSSTNYATTNHYAVPKRLSDKTKLQLVPNFHEEKQDMGKV